MMKPSISIVVPALNEEANIAAAVEEILRVVVPRFSDYEILLVNDGSIDGTGEKMETLARGNPNTRVRHNLVPRNTGAALTQAAAEARFDYIMMIPGDNENPAQALIPILDAVGTADLIIPYTVNTKVRPFVRRLISRIYITLLNFLFGLRLRYYNGTSIYKTADLRRMTVRTDSFAHLAERLIKLIRTGCSYVEVGVHIGAPHGRRSKAFRLSNIVGVGQGLASLFYEVHVKGGWGTCR